MVLITLQRCPLRTVHCTRIEDSQILLQTPKALQAFPHPAWIYSFFIKCWKMLGSKSYPLLPPLRTFKTRFMHIKTIIVVGARKSEGFMLPCCFPSHGYPPTHRTQLCLLSSNKSFLQLHLQNKTAF